MNQETEIDAQNQIEIFQVDLVQQSDQTEKNRNDQLKQENIKIKDQNQKLFEKINHMETQLHYQNELLKQYDIERQQILKDNVGLKKIVEQQRDFINQVNEDQAYADLTNQLEISLQKLKENSEYNSKLEDDNSQLLSIIKQQQIDLSKLNEKVLQLSQNLNDSKLEKLTMTNQGIQIIETLQNRVITLEAEVSELKSAQ